MRPEIFDDPHWQMSWGERAAVEGLLSLLRPPLALEIGSMEGACLRRIADHSGEVHSFDLQPPTLEQPDNVTLHTGDSHELLPQFLAELADAGRNVDFAMVDGDHTPEGVRKDLEDLLNSPAVARAVIVIHDTANERVREGIEEVSFRAWPKVTHVDLDWIPGRLFAEPALRNELWYGLGLVLVDSAAPAYLSGEVFQQRYAPSGPLLAEVRERVLARERSPAGENGEGELEALRERSRALSVELAMVRTRYLELQRELADARQSLSAAEGELNGTRQSLAAAEAMQARASRVLADVMGSASWKLTKPLRGAKRLALPERSPSGE